MEELINRSKDGEKEEGKEKREKRKERREKRTGERREERERKKRKGGRAKREKEREREETTGEGERMRRGITSHQSPLILGPVRINRPPLGLGLSLEW